MYKVLFAATAIFLLSCSTTRYYIVRHAEKEAAVTMTTDVPLSAEGKQRAESLRDLLVKEKIRRIYSTNFIRTKATAQPLADAKGIAMEVYDAGDTSFFTRLKAENSDILVVGHSNTVDDLVNKFMGEKLLNDLPDSQYGDLFVISRKGNRYQFERRHFGK